jgi:hypothetical protein
MHRAFLVVGVLAVAGGSGACAIKTGFTGIYSCSQYSSDGYEGSSYCSHADGGSVAISTAAGDLRAAPNRRPGPTFSPATFGSSSPSAPAGASSLKMHYLAEFRIQKDWDASYVMSFLGGVRWVNDTRFKYPYFYEISAGVTTFPGDTIFTVHPIFGFLFPRTGKSYAFFAQGGLPISFYDGGPTLGTEFSVGLQFAPIGKK